MNDIFIILVILVLWLFVVAVLHRSEQGRKRLSFLGPALVLKTERGRKFISSISKYKFWKYYGNFGIIFSFIIMVATVALLIWEATLVPSIPRGHAPSPVEALGLPGINPLIPLWYGLLAIIIAVIFHELSHGILVRTQKLKIKSLGVLIFIVPLGAFVEPDEEELLRAPKIKRMRVFAAGATTNIIIAIITAMLFFALFSGVSAKTEGVVLTHIYADPFNTLHPGMEVTDINNTKITSVAEVSTLKLDPGSKVNVTAWYNGKLLHMRIYVGVIIVQVLANTPAAMIGIQPGSMITKVDNTTIYNIYTLTSYLDNTTANQKVTIHMLMRQAGQVVTVSKTVRLMDKYQYYAKNMPSLNSPRFIGKGFLGIASMYLGSTFIDVKAIPAMLSNPVGTITPDHIFHGFLFYVSLPFAKLAPLPTAMAKLYTTPFMPALFWVFVNIVYWISWLNLMLGMTNLLPAVPLDGGYMFRDGFFLILKKLKIKLQNIERTAGTITTFLSVLILILILWQFIGPRVL